MVKLKNSEGQDHANIPVAVSEPAQETLVSSQPVDNDKACAEEFLDYKKELLASRTSNIEKSDQAILTLSSLFLGTTLTFLKDIVPLKEALHLWLMLASWSLFFLSIFCVLVSLQTARKSNEQAEERAYKFYILKQTDAFNDFDKKILTIKITNWLNTAGVACFLTGILFLVVFTSINLRNVSIR